MPGLEHGKVCIFGAGGPVGAMAAQALGQDYTLRLTDLLDIEDILANRDPQSKHAPLPKRPEAPHEWRCVDVTQYEQVCDAARGMDALINVTVIRPELVGAFRVNLVGSYNVMQAAVQCGIRRVVHTGPRHLGVGFDGDGESDFDIPDEAPLVSGSHLYALTKQLGAEVVRTFAEEHGIRVMNFLYCGFQPGDDGDAEDGSGLGPFTISWEDTGEVFRYALRAADLPRFYEVFHICANTPHSKYSPDKAERLLGWKPQHNFERLYRRPKN